MPTYQYRSPVFRHLATAPDSLAVHDGQNPLNWRELDEETVRAMKKIAGLELSPGDRIGLLMSNHAGALVWQLAAISMGLRVVPLNWHLTADELAYIATDAQLGCVIADEALLGKVSACREFSPAQLAQATFAVESVGSDSPAGAIMLYTSGTTGRPKGVVRHYPPTLGAMIQQWRDFGASVGLDGGRHLVTGPLYHAAPLLFALYDLLNGASLVLMPRFDAAQALSLIDEFNISHTHWVPTMFVRALRLPAVSREQFSGHSLQLVLHGAAPIAPAIKEQMINWWGPCLVEYWGGSESGAICRCTSEEWLSHKGTVGRILPQYEVAATRNGKLLPEGEVGLLGIRHRSGEPVFSYWRDQDKTLRAYLDTARFQLGDIGYVKDDFVYLLDRESHTVICGGVNIYPAEVEAVLLEQASVVDVAVFGVADEEWGETLVAVIELPAGIHGSPALADVIRQQAAGKLASFKLPRTIWFQSIPRNAAGKVNLKRLRADLAL